MRCGVIWSPNNLITRDRGPLEQDFYFAAVPSLVQEQLRLIIEDDGDPAIGEKNEVLFLVGRAAC